MPKQCTLEKNIKLMGEDCYGGNPFQVTIYPSDPDTGIIFSDGEQVVPVKNEYLEPAWRLSLVKTLVLKNPETKLKIRGLEHILGTFFVYGIDNAIIELKMDPKLSYRLFHHFGIALRNTLIADYLPDLQRGLCNRIEEVGVRNQGEPRKTLRLGKGLAIDTEKLKLEQIDGDHVEVEVTTKYALSNGEVVKDIAKIALVPKQYKNIAHARAFFGAPLTKLAPKSFTRKTGILHSLPMLVSKSAMKIIGNVLYLGYGLGYGANEGNSFYPPNSESEWREKEMIKGEIAYHGIIDKAGDFIKRLDLAFNARPAGMKLTCKFAGHHDSHDLIRDCQSKYQNKFYVE